MFLFWVNTWGSTASTVVLGGQITMLHFNMFSTQQLFLFHCQSNWAHNLWLLNIYCDIRGVNIGNGTVRFGYFFKYLQVIARCRRRIAPCTCTVWLVKSVCSHRSAISYSLRRRRRCSYKTSAVSLYISKVFVWFHVYYTCWDSTVGLIYLMNVCDISSLYYQSWTCVAKKMYKVRQEVLCRSERGQWRAMRFMTDTTELHISNQKHMHVAGVMGLKNSNLKSN